MKKENLYNLLKKGPVLVHFIKDDGSERVMRATTNEGLINYKPKSKTKTRAPKYVMRVWDLDINQWRSIREDRVIGWTDTV